MLVHHVDAAVDGVADPPSRTWPPRTLIVPLSGCTAETTFTRVLLPAPFSPSRQWISPWLSVRSTSSLAMTRGRSSSHRARPGPAHGHCRSPWFLPKVRSEWITLSARSVCSIPRRGSMFEAVHPVTSPFGSAPGPPAVADRNHCMQRSTLERTSPEAMALVDRSDQRIGRIDENVETRRRGRRVSIPMTGIDRSRSDCGCDQSQAEPSPTTRPSIPQTPVSMLPSARPARTVSTAVATSAGISASWNGA